jgi:hypothetical protein
MVASEEGTGVTTTLHLTPCRLITLMVGGRARRPSAQVGKPEKEKMPTIFPSVESRCLGDAAPGDLVRTTYGGSDTLAFVAGQGDGSASRHLVILERIGEAPEIVSPFLCWNVDLEERVMYFGSSYRIDLATGPDNLHVRWFEHAEMPGIICANGSNHLLRVGPEPGRGFQRAWYGLKSGLMEKPTGNDCCYVSAWALGLDIPAGMPPRTLLEFNVR